MQLSNNFSLEELTTSDTAIRKGIDNTPPPEIIANLKLLAVVLEQARLILGKPIHVNSAYRCKELNQTVGGSKTSAHVEGLAADIICPQFGTPLEVCRALAKGGIAFDQVIHEFGKWAHVGLAKPGIGPRSELLTIASAETGYQPGLLTV